MKLHSQNNKQSGFSVVEVVLVVVVLAFVAIVVMSINDRRSPDTDSNTNTVIDPIPIINNAQDLDAAEDTLNDTDLDSLDDSELDASVDELL